MCEEKRAIAQGGNMERGTLILEVGNKKIYTAINDGNENQFYYIAEIDDRVNFFVENVLLRKLNSEGVPNDYVERNDQNSNLVIAVDIIPIEVYGWNFTTKEHLIYGVEEDEKLDELMIALKLNEQLIGEDEVVKLGLLSDDELKDIQKYAETVNDVLSDFFSILGIELKWFKIRFGRELKNNNLILVGFSLNDCNFSNITEEEFKMGLFAFLEDVVVEAI